MVTFVIVFLMKILLNECIFSLIIVWSILCTHMFMFNEVD